LSLSWINAQSDDSKWNQLPSWGQDSVRVEQDTIKLKQNASLIQLNRKFYTGLGIIVISASAAWIYHDRAEKSYGNYLKDGNLSKINYHYNRAKKYDQYTVVAYLSVQAGIILLIKSIYK